MDTCVQFYTELYTQEFIPGRDDIALQDIFLKQIPQELMYPQHYDLLNKPVTEQELYKALCTMKTDKAPGINGLTVEFFRTFWPQISKLVHGALMEGYADGEMSASQWRGVLRLVPKKNSDLLLVRKWRPITLLTVDYKLLSKALALRLREVLPDLVHPDQKGFIKNRYIGDSVMDVYALIAQVENNDEEDLLLLLDIQAAFDSVSWSFLHRILETYNFPESFIHWIKVLYTNKEIRILNHGFMSKPIHPTKGLAQGDGLSALLFTLTIETLALSIRNNTEIQGIACNGLQKKIALLADDAILALKHNDLSFKALLDTLKYFATVSNLKVNRDKSVLIRVGKNVTDRAYSEEMWQFVLFDKDEFSHLGIDIVPKTPATIRMCQCVTNYEPIPLYVDRVLGKRDDLSHTILGCILSVKTFVASKLLYTYSMAPSPKPGFNKKLQSKLNQYVWSSGYHAVNAKLMYQPWDTGGMSMYCCQTQEHSLKLKWLNHLVHNENEFWQIQLRSCFNVPVNMLLQMNCNYMHLLRFLKPNVNIPLIWRDILQIWCSYNYCKKVTDPADILLIGNQRFATHWVFHSELMLAYQEQGIFTVRDLLDITPWLPADTKKDLCVNVLLYAALNFWKNLTNDNYEVSKWQVDFTKVLKVRNITQAINQYNAPQVHNVWNKWEEELGTPFPC